MSDHFVYEIVCTWLFFLVDTSLKWLTNTDRWIDGEREKEIEEKQTPKTKNAIWNEWKGSQKQSNKKSIIQWLCEMLQSDVLWMNENTRS